MMQKSMNFTDNQIAKKLIKKQSHDRQKFQYN